MSFQDVCPPARERSGGPAATPAATPAHDSVDPPPDYSLLPMIHFKLIDQTDRQLMDDKFVTLYKYCRHFGENSNNPSTERDIINAIGAMFLGMLKYSNNTVVEITTNFSYEQLIRSFKFFLVRSLEFLISCFWKKRHTIFKMGLLYNYLESLK